ncbi:MAG TPA: lactate utilization protein [Cytophagaceae bacterium]|jgi:L-lactate dehydrogenase complex protein LldG|nr:lactate utilization protein [Cytophagaceae bacterium]
MNLAKSREKILKKVRKALLTRKPTVPEPDFNSEIFTKDPEKDLSVIFAENFVKAKGEFIYCEDLTDFENSISSLVKIRGLEKIFLLEPVLEEMLLKARIPVSNTEENFLGSNIGITSCESLVARTGSLIVSSKNPGGRRIGIYPPVHIVIAYTSQIVEDIKDGLSAIKKKYNGAMPSMISLVTGPSRTSDIEKTLVMGAHGPKELILFLIDDTSN